MSNNETYVVTWNRGFSEGAKAVLGGRKQGNRGYFVEPTVPVDTKQDIKLVQRKSSGRSAVPCHLPTWRKCSRGKQLHLWPRCGDPHIRKAHRIAAELRAGSVWVNYISDAALLFYVQTSRITKYTIPATSARNPISQRINLCCAVAST
jgi:acyl-CoA reductase-like NAD-dependent aldehyde dehydrogenase